MVVIMVAMVTIFTCIYIHFGNLQTLCGMPSCKKEDRPIRARKFRRGLITKQWIAVRSKNIYD